MSTRLRERVTLTHQSWLFIVGSTLFAVATAPWAVEDVSTANLLCFIGSWFFTSAGWVQLVRSDPEGSAEWYSAAVQFAGTVLFNVSTGSAVAAHAVLTERRLVWTPDAVGSLAFLASGVLAIHAMRDGRPNPVDRWANWINMAGCVAFGVSALAAFIERSGATIDESLAGAGTFVGALCFLVASSLPMVTAARSRRPA